VTAGGIAVAKKKSSDDKPVSLDEMKAALALSEEKAKEIEAEEQRQEDQRAYERALERLPNRASPLKEMEFVRTHPAMSRKDRGEERVVLQAADIKKAPSVFAAQQLQHWCNKPEEFHKQMIGLQRKKVEAGEGDEAVGDDGPAEISRIDEMLQLLDGSVK